MDPDLQSLIRAWDGEAVITCYEPAHDAWIFVAIHSSALGQPTGGTRMRVYPRPADGLRDAMRLAEGMTSKWAGLGVAKGGAKAVLALPAPLAEPARRELLGRYGRLLNSLNGAFATGEDLGTTPEDMAYLSAITRWVHGGDVGRVSDPGPYTAKAVFHGIAAAARAAWDGAGLEGRTVLVQGAGDVGFPLIEELARAGARVLVADPDPERRARAVAAGAKATPVETATSEPCDIFAPCAIGGILDAATVERLSCRVVAGSANAQLATPEDADRLHARGILYVPDWIVNAGGALAIALDEEGRPEAEIAAEMARVGATVDAILDEAARSGETPVRVAERRVRHVLRRADERPPLPEENVYREVE